MPYGTIKVDNIIFTDNGTDSTVTVSGIVSSVSDSLTVTGTIQGASVIGTTLVSGTTGTFTTVTGTQGNFVTVSGTTVTGNAGQFTTITGTSAGFTTITGATVTGSVGNFGPGSAAAPSVSVGTTNNGLYLPGTDQIALSTGSSERIRIGANGEIGLSGANYGTSGQVLTSAGSGAAPTWQTPAAGAVDKIEEGNTSVEVIDTGSDGRVVFTTEGTEHARIDSSGRLLVGTSVVAGGNLLQLNSDALIYGLTIGRGTGSVSTNTAVGSEALFRNSTGFSNTAMGYAALFNNSTGFSNTANGASALYSNSIGGHNTAVGVSALGNNTAGNFNTAAGANALLNNTTGGGNVCLGSRNAAGSYAPVFNCTTESNRVVISSTSVTNAYIQVAWTVVSDARDKINFGVVPHGLEFIKQLNPISFQFKETRESETPHGPVRYGFKAQDILALEGEENAVIIDNEDPDKLRYNGEALVPVLVNAIKEQQTIIDALTARLDAAGI